MGAVKQGGEVAVASASLASPRSSQPFIAQLFPPKPVQLVPSDAEMAREGAPVCERESVRPTLTSGTGRTWEGIGLGKMRARTKIGLEFGYGISRGYVRESKSVNLVSEGVARTWGTVRTVTLTS